MHEMDKYKADHELYLRRENLTWEGSLMMLPEHKAAIRAADAEEKKVDKHILDPD
ncbi:YolD-like family protein [Alkalicoccobacillus porphyridii]|uniref:YolD-like family protein n=1 Tax=Alkalicoccobacillus porphyridii TaxID=2597270 RepID=A0A553ZTW5_9BACI|nr:YolD-like family protein [Alkalicoccobacillus porphyridii]TSB44919.1 YolD-like family protein [Alkalicoccobacillus porphyridii]